MSSLGYKSVEIKRKKIFTFIYSQKKLSYIELVETHVFGLICYYVNSYIKTKHSFTLEKSF